MVGWELQLLLVPGRLRPGGGMVNAWSKNEKHGYDGGSKIYSLREMQLAKNVKPYDK